MGTTLTTNESVRSPNGQYVLVVQSDGNLVFYKGGSARWASNTEGQQGVFLAAQADGNVVLYNAAHAALWATGTNGQGASSLAVQDDGKVAVYKGGTFLGTVVKTDTGGGVANIRNGPSLSAGIVRTAKNYAPLTIRCYSTGSSVTGKYGTTSLWNQLTDGAWISDAMVNTGSNSAIVPACGGSNSGGGPIGDDYPSNYKNAAMDSLVDQWNYFNRECTSFVAWRLNSVNHVAFHNRYGGQHWGNANTWGPAARAMGIAVDGSPRRGSIAWSSAGQYGHVAWVAQVLGDGRVVLEEYNYGYTGRYNQRTVSASAYQYIHLND